MEHKKTNLFVALANQQKKSSDENSLNVTPEIQISPNPASFCQDSPNFIDKLRIPDQKSGGNSFINPIFSDPQACKQNNLNQERGNKSFTMSKPKDNQKMKQYDFEISKFDEFNQSIQKIQI